MTETLTVTKRSEGNLEKMRATLARVGLRSSAVLPLAGAALASTSPLHAGVISRFGNIQVTDGSRVEWDINGDSVKDIELFDNADVSTGFCTSPQSASDFFVLASSSVNGAGFVHEGSGLLRSISDTTVVGPGDSFSNMSCATHDNPCNVTQSSLQDFRDFPGASPNFSGRLGFRFDNNGQTNYGVANFNFTGLDAQLPHGIFTITSWSYENTGLAIFGSAAPAVPEPASVAVWAGLTALASGAVGTETS